jgi:hypothetical protein
MMVLNKSGSVWIPGLFYKYLNFIKEKEPNITTELQYFIVFFAMATLLKQVVKLVL